MILPRRSPENSSAILRFVEALESRIKEVHSFMLLRHGHVVAEGWWSPYAPTYPHSVFSLSKSFTSTAVGLAISENHLSLDDAVLSYFPEDAPRDASDFLKQMRVRHLLTMSTGHAEDTWSHMLERADGNWIQAFLNVPVVHPPGTHFLYNTGATYMLSAIVQKRTGMKLVNYLQTRLFEPLGIEGATWDDSPQGISMGGIGLHIKTEDIARFGQLYLQQGIWQGVQLLPADWVSEATASQISNSDSGQLDWAQGYGYQFWRCRHNAYRGDGVFGQYCVVMPDQDAVLAMTGGMDVFDMQEPLNLLWEILLPAMQADALPDDDTSAELTRKLSNLKLLPVQGEASSAIASQVSGRIYTVEANALDIQTISLTFAEQTCQITLNTSANLLCGYGDWHYGQITLFEQSPFVATCGAWTGENTFTVVFRLYTTPFYYTMTCDFFDDELLIEIRVNASLDSTQPIVMIANA